jgi:hypothetical protein
MNLMFWKKKTPGDTQQDETDDDLTVAIPRDGETAEENNNEEDAVRPGLLTRLRNALSALRKPRDSGIAIDGDEAEAPQPNAADRRDDETPAVVPARNMKKRLIIGGAIGLLVILLAGIGFAITKILQPDPEHKPATAEASHATHPAPHAETPQTEIEALKKKNAELQTQLEAIKKEQTQAQSPTMRSQETGEHATSSPLSSGGEMTVSNKDPKAAAQALKAAIEAMNAGSDEQKPHKPAP